MDEKRRLNYAHFGVSERTPFVAWKYEGDTSESRRTFDTMQQAQDEYNALARHAQTYGIMPTHEPVSAHLMETNIAMHARIAELEAEVARLRGESAEAFFDSWGSKIDANAYVAHNDGKSFCVALARYRDYRAVLTSGTGNAEKKDGGK